MDKDYSVGYESHTAHYGADELMAEDIVGFLREESDSLPVSIIDALEAGLVAMTLDESRKSGKIKDLTETWAKFDSYGFSKSK